MRFKLSITIIAFILFPFSTESASDNEGPFWNKKRKLCKKLEKPSQYKGIHWCQNNEKWRAQLYLKGQGLKYGGYFKDELDAAKRMNQLCAEMEIPLQNPGINAMPTQQGKKTEQTSQYKGVYWHKSSRKWYAFLQNAKSKKFGGSFKTELDAAKRVNQLCEASGIPLKNPRISAMPTEQYQYRENTSNTFVFE